MASVSTLPGHMMRIIFVKIYMKFFPSMVHSENSQRTTESGEKSENRSPYSDRPVLSLAKSSI